MPKKHNESLRSDAYFRSIAVGDVDEYLRLKVETCDKEEFFVSQQDLVYFEDYPLLYPY